MRSSKSDLFSSKVLASSQSIRILSTCNASIAALWKPQFMYPENTKWQVDESGWTLFWCICSTINSITSILPCHPIINEANAMLTICVLVHGLNSLCDKTKNKKETNLKVCGEIGNTRCFTFSHAFLRIVLYNRTSCGIPSRLTRSNRFNASSKSP